MKKRQKKELRQLQLFHYLFVENIDDVDDIKDIYEFQKRINKNIQRVLKAYNFPDHLFEQIYISMDFISLKEIVYMHKNIGVLEEKLYINFKKNDKIFVQQYRDVPFNDAFRKIIGPECKMLVNNAAFLFKLEYVQDLSLFKNKIYHLCFHQKKKVVFKY